MVGDRLTVLVPGQAVPSWTRGWIKLQRVPAVVIVAMIMATGAPESAMSLQAQVPVRLKSTGVLVRLGPRSTDHFSRAKLTTSPEFLPKFLEGGKQAMAGSVIQRHIVKIA
jgi:hypothetical protein